MKSDPEILRQRQIDRARDLWAWHDNSILDVRKPARRKLKRARRLFELAGVAR
jgi:hypothetical protein